MICQSLNGSYLASVLSSLLGLDLFIIDGVGPINKLYRSLGATIETGKKYIVVSDVVCLGTEFKICPYNSLHILKANLYQIHIINCKDKPNDENEDDSLDNELDNKCDDSIDDDLDNK